MADENITLDFDCPASFLLQYAGKTEILNDTCHAHIEKEKLSLLTATGKNLVFYLRDLLKLQENDYHLLMTFAPNLYLDVFKLGFKFEDFSRVLNHNYHELILQDSLYHEKTRLADVKASLTYMNHQGQTTGPVKCEIRVFETSLTLIPISGPIIRFPFRDIFTILSENYCITVITDTGETIILSQLGYQLDRVYKTLCQVLNELTTRTLSFLQDLLPTTHAAIIQQITPLFKDGKIARRQQLEAISPTLWIELENAISRTPLADSYHYLKSLGNEAHLAIGFKRGLLGGPKHDYSWFFVPMTGNEPGKPTNIIAFEAGNIHLPDPDNQEDIPPHDENEENLQQDDKPGESLLKQEGKATYFFHLMDINQWASLNRQASLEPYLDQVILSFNHCMQEINFRREPIYLPADRLEEPRFKNYKYALLRLPGLQRLRTLFIGRVMHKSLEQWKKDVHSLIVDSII